MSTLLANEAREFLAHAQASRPLVALLRGPLGAGKTTFVKAVVEALGGQPGEVQSPTFLKSIVYDIPGFGQLVHIDGYRIEDADDVEKLSLEMYAEARAWFIEWPDVILEWMNERPGLKAVLGWRRVWDVDFEGDGEKVARSLGWGDKGA